MKRKTLYIKESAEKLKTNYLKELITLLFKCKWDSKRKGMKKVTVKL